MIKIANITPDPESESRFNARIKSFYQRKKSKTNGIVAIKAVAHKLCRACYYIMRDWVAFNITKAFGQK